MKLSCVVFLVVLAQLLTTGESDFRHISNGQGVKLRRQVNDAPEAPTEVEDNSIYFTMPELSTEFQDDSIDFPKVDTDNPTDTDVLVEKDLNNQPSLDSNLDQGTDIKPQTSVADKALYDRTPDIVQKEEMPLDSALIQKDETGGANLPEDIPISTPDVVQVDTIQDIVKDDLTSSEFISADDNTIPYTDPDVLQVNTIQDIVKGDIPSPEFISADGNSTPNTDPDVVQVNTIQDIVKGDVTSPELISADENTTPNTDVVSTSEILRRGGSYTEEEPYTQTIKFPESLDKPMVPIPYYFNNMRGGNNTDQIVFDDLAVIPPTQILEQPEVIYSRDFERQENVSDKVPELVTPNNSDTVELDIEKPVIFVEGALRGTGGGVFVEPNPGESTFIVKQNEYSIRLPVMSAAAPKYPSLVDTEAVKGINSEMSATGSSDKAISTNPFPNIANQVEVIKNNDVKTTSIIKPNPSVQKTITPVKASTPVKSQPTQTKSNVPTPTPTKPAPISQVISDSTLKTIASKPTPTTQSPSKEQPKTGKSSPKKNQVDKTAPNKNTPIVKLSVKENTLVKPAVKTLTESTPTKNGKTVKIPAPKPSTIGTPSIGTNKPVNNALPKIPALAVKPKTAPTKPAVSVKSPVNPNTTPTKSASAVKTPVKSNTFGNTTATKPAVSVKSSVKPNTAPPKSASAVKLPVNPNNSGNTTATKPAVSVKSPVNPKTTPTKSASAVKSPVKPNTAPPKQAPAVKSPVKPAVKIASAVKPPVKPAVKTAPAVKSPVKPAVKTAPAVKSPVKPAVKIAPVVKSPIKPAVKIAPAVKPPVNTIASKTQVPAVKPPVNTNNLVKTAPNPI